MEERSKILQHMRDKYKAQMMTRQNQIEDNENQEFILRKINLLNEKLRCLCVLTPSDEVQLAQFHEDCDLCFWEIQITSRVIDCKIGFVSNSLAQKMKNNDSDGVKYDKNHFITKFAECRKACEEKQNLLLNKYGQRLINKYAYALRLHWYCFCLYECFPYCLEKFEDVIMARVKSANELCDYIDKNLDRYNK